MMTAIKKLLGRLGFMWCGDCGSRLIWDKERFEGGYGLRYECPHCDHLDRFDVSEVVNGTK